MKTIENNGWFLRTLSALACGDAAALLDGRENAPNPYLHDGYGPRPEQSGIERLYHIFIGIKEGGFARISRRGWYTLQHPHLGVIQWKSGIDFRSAGIYFILRVNDKAVLTVWPAGGGRYSSVKWDAAPKAPVAVPNAYMTWGLDDTGARQDTWHTAEYSPEYIADEIRSRLGCLHK